MVNSNLHYLNLSLKGDSAKMMVLNMSNSCQCIDCGQTTDTEIFVEYLMFLEAFEDAIAFDLVL